MMALAEITSAWSGSCAPAALNAACRPQATRMPNSTPMTDAITATSAASSITEPRIWPDVAPCARSRPICRPRCAMVIWNALKMMNAPTNSAIPAKPNRTLRKMSTNAWNASADSRADSLVVTAS